MYVLTADCQQADAPAIVGESLKKTGFVVIRNHAIDQQLIRDVYAGWENFFNSQEKFAYLYDKEKQDAYFPFRSENAKYTPVKDLKEFYHYYSWGRCPENLRVPTQTLYDQLNLLAAIILHWVENFTPMEIRESFSVPLARMIKDSPLTLLRILNYPPLTGQEEEGAVRAAPHEDICLLTLLPAATATGLQVKDLQGRWHDVEADTGSIVVNIGDMLQLCTQGYYQSTTHQVVNPQGEIAKQARLSMPLFLHPHDTVQLSLQHTAESYRWERLREIGLA